MPAEVKCETCESLEKALRDAETACDHWKCEFKHHHSCNKTEWDLRTERDSLRVLLSEGLDLCVRARKLDADIEEALAAGNTTMTRCGTPALWVEEQYEKDLMDWERRATECLK